MNEQEKNKILAEWVGFKGRFINKYKIGGAIDTIRGYEYPSGVHRERLPSFTQSLDACFKWLVPKLFEFGYSCGMIIAEVSSEARYRFVVDLASTEFGVEAQDTNPALALCDAILKLIEDKK